MKITIIAFNFGPTKKFTNGPGISLFNFVNIIRQKYRVDLFTHFESEVSLRGVNMQSIDDFLAFKTSLASSNTLHHWSGIDSRYMLAGKVANNVGLPLIIGPNVLDCVEKSKEDALLEGVTPNLVLSVNERLKYKIAKEHNIDLDSIKTLIIGPDLKKWGSKKISSNKILWKGNSKHKVKDIGFAFELQKAMPQYKFKFLGYPNLYNYNSHISKAKDSRLYINTSISETKSMTTMESWASGVPSVTHPKIYLHGENYVTGIITNKTIEDYSEAITEIMEDDNLHSNLSNGARQYCLDHFSSDVILEQYEELLEVAAG